MSKAKAKPAPVQPFAAAIARDDHWGLAAKTCLEGIAGQPANVGFLYASEAFNQHLSSILTFLRETTHIETWVGAVAPGICGAGAEVRDGGGLAVMVGQLPEGSFRTFSGLDATAMGSGAFTGAPSVAFVHGDPRNPGLPGMIDACTAFGGFLVGGLVSASGPPAQVAGSVVSGGLSGLWLSPGLPVLTGLTQGCTPLGPVHVVTEANQGVLMELDGRQPLDILREEAGELIARDLRRAAGYIHVALPVENSDRGDYLVRTLMGIDPHRGWLAVGESLEVGQKVLFVRRDPNAARLDMQRMLSDVERRLDGRPVLAAHYTTCTARGRHMFGEDGAELEMIRDVLGDIPLVGFFANGEISGDRLYGYTGVLTLLAGDKVSGAKP